MLFGKHLNKYYIKYLPLLLFGVISLIFVDYVETILPEYLGDIIDTINDTVGNITFGEISTYLWKILACAGIMMICRVLWRLCILHFANKVQEHIRHEMFVKAETLSIDYYQNNKVGTVMAWFTTDVETIGDFLSWGTVQLVDSSFLTILVVVKMIRVNVPLTIISLIPILLIIVWGALVEYFIGKRWEERQAANDRLYDFVEENFTGIRVIKAFVKETKELHAFARIAKKNQDVNFKFGRTMLLFDILIEVIISLVFAVIFGFGGWIIYSVYNGQTTFLGIESNLTIGRLTEFIALFDILIWPMIAMGQIMTARGRAKASLKRISNFLDADVMVKNPENGIVLNDVKGKITFKHLSFRYTLDSDEVLKDCSFEIQPGEIIGVVGKIGSGKTTFANLLLRIYNINPESIYIDDNDITECDIDSIRNAIAYAPQDNFLFSDKIENNISFSSKTSDKEKVTEAAEFADVANDIIAFKEQYDTVLGERGVTISGGQKQRISLARAYYKNAPIMILDDTVSAVDVKTEEKILNNIRENRKGKTTIVIASRVSTVSSLDKVLVFVDGKVDGFDTHSNLMNSCEPYKKMVYLQKLEAEMES